MAPLVRNVGRFTIEAYRLLVQSAIKNYTPASFSAIPWGSNFILWRHDIDLSVNRALRLARINSEFGLHSTFFVNLHSQFYNVFESSQLELLHEIVDLGHDVGVHFDMSHYSNLSEDKFCERLDWEAKILQTIMKVDPTAFSFHDPSASDLNHQKEMYAGLQNAYSQKLNTEARYCSDSNGYWRFEPLPDVLAQLQGPLQVLIHPGWWQEIELPPRSRVHRTVFGRAQSVMANYDSNMETVSRENLDGKLDLLESLTLIDSGKKQVWDYLWHVKEFGLLSVDLESHLAKAISNFLSSVFESIPRNAPISLSDSHAALREAIKWFEIAFGKPFLIDVHRRSLGGSTSEKLIIKSGESVQDTHDLEDYCAKLSGALGLVFSWEIRIVSSLDSTTQEISANSNEESFIESQVTREDMASDNYLFRTLIPSLRVGGWKELYSAIQDQPSEKTELPRGVTNNP